MHPLLFVFDKKQNETNSSSYSPNIIISSEYNHRILCFFLFKLDKKKSLPFPEATF